MKEEITNLCQRHHARAYTTPEIRSVLRGAGFALAALAASQGYEALADRGRALSPAGGFLGRKRTLWATEALAAVAWVAVRRENRCTDGSLVHDFKGQDRCPSCGWPGLQAPAFLALSGPGAQEVHHRIHHYVPDTFPRTSDPRLGRRQGGAR